MDGLYLKRLRGFHKTSKITLASAPHTRWSERNRKWVVVGALLSLEATLLCGKQPGKKGVSGDTNVFTWKLPNWEQSGMSYVYWGLGIGPRV